MAGEASSAAELARLVSADPPDVVVLDDTIGVAAVQAVAELAPDAKLVVIWPAAVLPIAGATRIDAAQVHTALAPAVAAAAGFAIGMTTIDRPEWIDAVRKDPATLREKLAESGGTHPQPSVTELQRPHAHRAPATGWRRRRTAAVAVAAAAATVGAPAHARGRRGCGCDRQSAARHRRARRRRRRGRPDDRAVVRPHASDPRDCGAVRSRRVGAVELRPEPAGRVDDRWGLTRRGERWWPAGRWRRRQRRDRDRRRRRRANDRRRRHHFRYVGFRLDRRPYRPAVPPATGRRWRRAEHRRRRRPSTGDGSSPGGDGSGNGQAGGNGATSPPGKSGEHNPHGGPPGQLHHGGRRARRRARPRRSPGPPGAERRTTRTSLSTGSAPRTGRRRDRCPASIPRVDAYSPIQRIYVRTPHADAFTNWRAYGWHAEPDAEATAAEHAALVDTLRASVPDVVVGTEPVAGDPDAVYAYDATLVTDAGVIPLLPGKEGRRGEPAIVAAELAAAGLATLPALEPPGTAEGGDMLFLDSETLLVGIGYRTNAAGAAAAPGAARGPGRHDRDLRPAALPRARGMPAPDVVPVDAGRRPGGRLPADDAGAARPTARGARHRHRRGARGGVRDVGAERARARTTAGPGPRRQPRDPRPDGSRRRRGRDLRRGGTSA